MARLKGGSHVAGSMTVEGTLTVGALQLDVTKQLIFGAVENLTTGTIPIADAGNELADSVVSYETGPSLLTIDSPTKIIGALEATEQIQGASIGIEDNGTSGYILNILSASSLTSSKTLTIDTGNVNRQITLGADLTVSGTGTTLVSGTMVPTSRTVAGKALTSNVTLETLSITPTSNRDSVVSTTYNPSTAKTLYIYEPGQNLETNSSVTFSSLAISASTASTSKDTGALIVQNGGMGIEGDLYVGGDLNVTGAIHCSELYVDGYKIEVV